MPAKFCCSVCEGCGQGVGNYCDMNDCQGEMISLKLKSD